MRDALNATVSELQAYDDTEAEMETVMEGGNSVRDEAVSADGGGGLSAVLNLILVELRAMRKERAEITNLRRDYDNLHEAVAQQQHFLERIDSREREMNIIITGVPEQNDLDGAATDQEKCDRIMDIMGVTDVQLEITRIGKAETDKIRPMLAKAPSKAGRDKVLDNTKALKSAGEAFRRVYVKKDLHPAVRREWKRLRDAETEEREKPENQGVDIRLDFRKRVLLRDNVVIDKWKPNLFH